MVAVIYLHTKRLKKIIPLLGFLLITGCQLQQGAPKADLPNIDVQYARKLWHSLSEQHMVGEDARVTAPFFGGAKPHGTILEVSQASIQVGDHIGFAIVKKNYNGEDVSIANVAADRSKYLSSITVMYQREIGYDVDNQNWFWVKYMPNGDIAGKSTTNGEMKLAGRLIKGPTAEDSRGCIYCHRSAGGGDYVFYPDIHVPPLPNQ